MAYEITVDLSRRILAVTHGFPGVENEGIVRYDAALKRQSARMSLSCQSNLWSGTHVIVGGGYHKVRCSDGCEDDHRLCINSGNSHLRVEAVQSVPEGDRCTAVSLEFSTFLIGEVERRIR